MLKHTDVQFHLGLEAWTKHWTKEPKRTFVKVIVLSLFGGSL